MVLTLRMRAVPGAITLAALAAAHALAPAPAHAQASPPRCPEGQMRVVDLGVRQIKGPYSHSWQTSPDGSQQTRSTWVFMGEPQVLAIDPNGPAAGRLREGDVIVAVDGHLITTREGGRRLGSIRAGQPVELMVRRAGRRVDVTVVPRWSCEEKIELEAPTPAPAPTPADAPSPPPPTRWVVRPITPVEPAPPAPPVPRADRADRESRVSARAPRALQAPKRPSVAKLAERGWFGVGLNCGECGFAMDDSFVVWKTSELPVIFSVDPGSPAARAGLQRGDKLVKIDNHSLLTPEGARRFGAVKPGQSVRWTYERDGVERQVVALAAERPDVAGTYSRSLSRLKEDLQKRAEDYQRRIAESGERDAELARLAAEIEAALAETPRPELAGTQRLRYSGVVGDADIEVKSLGAVTVTKDEATGEIIIATADATVRIKPSAKAPNAPKRPK